MNIDGAGNLTLQTAAPLYLDGTGALTSSVGEAPTDGLAYGRLSSGWHRVLAITGDVLDGGNF
jgi:hypothetical protein